MSDPDKTYAKNAISKASKDYKIAIVLDYQLTTFAILCVDQPSSL